MSPPRIQPLPAKPAGVRCPKCQAKLAESLNGVAAFTCRSCKSVVTIARQDEDVAQDNAAA